MRKRRENEMLDKYASAVMAFSEAKNNYLMAKDELLNVLQSITDLRSKNANVADYILWEQYKATAEQRCKTLHDEMDKRQAEMTFALSEWLKARKDREIVDKYREKQKAKYDLEARREEQKILDEMGIRSCQSTAMAYQNPDII